MATWACMVSRVSSLSSLSSLSSMSRLSRLSSLPCATSVGSLAHWACLVALVAWDPVRHVQGGLGCQWPHGLAWYPGCPACPACPGCPASPGVATSPMPPWPPASQNGVEWLVNSYPPRKCSQHTLTPHVQACSVFPSHTDRGNLAGSRCGIAMGDTTAYFKRMGIDRPQRCT